MSGQMLITYREAGPADAAAIHALEASDGSTAWSLQSVTDHLALPYSRSFVAVSESEIVAHVCAATSADVAEISMITVRADHRRSGIARALVELVAGDSFTVQLEVAARNASARAFYRSLGFTVVGERREYYANGDTAVLLTRGVPATTSELP